MMARVGRSWPEEPSVGGSSSVPLSVWGGPHAGDAGFGLLRGGRGLAPASAAPPPGPITPAPSGWRLLGGPAGSGHRRPPLRPLQLAPPGLQQVQLPQVGEVHRGPAWVRQRAELSCPHCGLPAPRKQRGGRVALELVQPHHVEPASVDPGPVQAHQQQRGGVRRLRDLIHPQAVHDVRHLPRDQGEVPHRVGTPWRELRPSARPLEP
mmetsp:Transcript_18871/g.50043  ORF Transcript_18871/g.50043 Transcript_18871/m.50043 type:complete len:208 (+) Transcript_18871:171-794(+)